MKHTLTRNVVLVWSIAALCAALIGCSSGDDDSGDLERQLDMAQAALAAAEDAQMMVGQERDDALDAQMTAEGERDAALAAQGMAEQAAIDTRVNLAAADKIRDAASYGVEKVSPVGNSFVVSKRDDWDNTINITAWLYDIALESSGLNYISMAQSYRDGSQGTFIPWYDGDGNLVFAASSGLTSPLQTDPGVWPFRVVNVTVPDGEGQTTAYGTIDDHGLGATWQGIEIIKTYEDGGTQTTRAFTDLTQSQGSADPFANHPGGDAAYPNVALDDPPVPATPAEWDGLWILAGDGLRGSLDGVPGTFSCAAGDRYCALESGRQYLAPGYAPDVGGDPVVFTPGDGSAETMLPHPEPNEVASVNYLAFGSWLFVPGDITDLDAYEFGVFTSGDDPFMVDNLQGLAGTADYAGEAAGTYADVSEAALSPFNAKVELTADFGTAQNFGTIEGRVYDFEIDGGQASPLAALNLGTAPWRAGGETNIHQSWAADGPPRAGGWVDGNAFSEDTTTAIWGGRWGGKFFGNGAAATDLPSAFGGTFGATDGDHTFAGSFGARQQ